jgi:hypothetical protein
VIPTNFPDYPFISLWGGGPNDLFTAPSYSPDGGAIVLHYRR